MNASVAPRPRYGRLPQPGWLTGLSVSLATFCAVYGFPRPVMSDWRAWLAERFGLVAADVESIEQPIGWRALRSTPTSDGWDRCLRYGCDGSCERGQP